MDYLLTFEDGSESLAHFGVKGMKWGVWNAETRARRNAVKNAEVASALGKAKQYKKDNGSQYYEKARSNSFGVTLSGKNHGETTNIHVHGFDDSKYTRTSKRIGVEAAKIHAARNESSKSPYTDRLAEGYITYLTKHGKQRLDKTNSSEIDLGKTAVQHLKKGDGELSEKERANHVNQIKASAKALENYSVTPVYERAGQDYVNHTKQMASSFRKLAENDPKLKKDIDEFTTMKKRTDDGRKYTDAYKKKACDIGERALGTRPAIDSPFCRTATFHPTAVTGKTVAIPAWALATSNSAIDYRHKQAAIRKAFQNPTYRDILEDD